MSTPFSNWSDRALVALLAVMLTALFAISAQLWLLTGTVSELGVDRIKEAQQEALELIGRHGRVRIESGTIRITREEYPAILQNSLCPKDAAGQRGAIGARKTFETPFVEPPEVILALNYLDHIKGDNLRIRADLREVDTHGFNYDIATWCHTAIHEVGVSWIAYK